MTRLAALVGDELAVPVDARVSEFARVIAERHAAAARAVLFYGSCLRDPNFDEQMLDFYLIVSDYRHAYASRLLAWANVLIPPNVFPVGIPGLTGKYAVLDEADFARMCRGQGFGAISVVARFAQPARLVWAADEAARAFSIESIADAAPALLAKARPLVENDDALAVWRAAFANTYRSELRAERGNRSDSIVDADPARYLRFFQAVDTGSKLATRKAAERDWAGIRRRGKLYSVARLLKAMATFSGGLDYLAWKINRHAGISIALSPWQRRWPLLGALTLLPELLRRGAVR